MQKRLCGPSFYLVMLVCGLLSRTALGGALLGPGDPFPPFQAEDQHGKAYTFEPGARAVLIAFQMSAAKAANRYLAEQPAEYLDDHAAVYIANIYGMPGIGRRFALPKMRTYPHRIVLADGKDLLTPFPQQAERVTVLSLDEAGVIRSVSYWNPETALVLP
ncbi:MAG: hypothetical protein AB7I04_10100 [Pseudomonadales bacterium]